MSDTTPNDHEQPGTPEPLVVASPELILPEGQRFITDPSMFPVDKSNRPVPRYSVQEAAKFFFASGPDWLRWRMRPDDKKAKDEQGNPILDEHGNHVMVEGEHPHGYFVLDGEPIEFARTSAGARYFTLYDIERMAHALAQGGQIDGAKLTQITRIVKTTAQMYGIVP